MGYAVGFSPKWNRDIGYGVPAVCEQPECNAEIDRGFGYLCGEAPYGSHGCGLYFCGEHLHLGLVPQCERCIAGQPPFDPKPDTEEWVNWKLTDPSWEQWRRENPEEVRRLSH